MRSPDRRFEHKYSPEYLTPVAATLLLCHGTFTMSVTNIYKTYPVVKSSASGNPNILQATLAPLRSHLLWQTSFHFPSRKSWILPSYRCLPLANRILICCLRDATGTVHNKIDNKTNCTASIMSILTWRGVFGIERAFLGFPSLPRLALRIRAFINSYSW